MSAADRLRIQALAAAMTTTPDALARRLVRVPEVIDGQVLDLRTRLFLTYLKLDHVEHHRLPVERQREEIDLAERTFAPPPEPTTRDWLEVPLPGRTLRFRRIVPDGAPRRALLYVHGGGFVTGTADAYDAFLSRLARRCDTQVVSLEYRLAPEHRFPAAVEDVADAWRWLRAHAAGLGLESATLAIGGDSAGGNLSAVICNTLPEGERPAFQLLLYPGTDMVTERPSRLRYAQSYYMSNDHVRWFYETYAPTEAERADPRASPLRAPELAPVPAVLVLAGLDTLVDEGRAYGERLAAAGVPLEVVDVPGMTHGFVNLHGILPAAERAVDTVIDAVGRAFAAAEGRRAAGPMA